MSRLRSTIGPQAISRLLGFTFAADGQFGASPRASASVNVAAVQRALDVAEARGGGTVTITQPGTYLLDNSLGGDNATYYACLLIGSNVHLHLGHGVTLKLDAGAKRYMVRNRTFEGNENIKITGGTWDSNNANNVGTDANWRGDCIYLRMCNHTYIAGMKIINVPKYSIWLSGGNDWTVENIDFNTPSAGLQFNGPVTRAIIRNLRGVCQDNMLAFCTTEGDYRPEVTTGGDITHVLVDGLVIESPTMSPVRMTGITGHTISDVTVRNMTGVIGSGSGFSIIDDVLSLQGVTIRRLVIDGLTVTVPSNEAAVLVDAANIESLTIRNAHIQGGARLLYAKSTLTNGKDFVLENIEAEGSTGGWVSVIGTLERLRISGMRGETTGGTMVYVGIGVGTVIMDNCHVEFSGVSGEMIRTGGSCRISVNNCHMSGGDAVLSYALASGGGKSYAVLSNTIIKGTVTMSVISNGEFEVGLNNVLAENMNRWARLSGAAARMRITGSGVTRIGTGTTIFSSSDPAGQFSANNPDFRLNITQAYLVPQQWDRAYNTDATGVGVGPVIYNGATWEKNGRA